MDTSDPTISFDGDGVCNHCRKYEAEVMRRQLSDADADAELRRLAERIKEKEKKHPYDCVLGLSGGMDSSYLAWLAKILGLRALLVHMDNSWDSEIATWNIEHIIQATGFDYYNYVIDWEEFRDLQVAYFKASVVDIEVVTDHAIRALLYQIATRFGVKTILRGSNPYTESHLPPIWGYEKNDLSNLLGIHDRYGTVSLETYPMLGQYKLLYHAIVDNIGEVTPLIYKKFRLKDTVDILKREFQWRDPGGKHYESIFTRFYQGYILPVKFGIDKRRGHYSSLIASQNMIRDDALNRLKSPPYDENLMQRDFDFVVKKLGFTRKEFEKIMALPVVPHTAFPRDRLTLFQRIFLSTWQLRRTPRHRFSSLRRTLKLTRQHNEK